jgi:hypothetical protein
MSQDLFNSHKQFLPLYKDVLSNMVRLNKLSDSSKEVQSQILEQFIDALETDNIEKVELLEPLVYTTSLKNMKNFSLT